MITEPELSSDSAPSFRLVLRNFSFVNLWLAQVFSQLADKVIFVYLVVLLDASGHGASSDISRLTLVNTLPAVIFGSLAGVFVDRWSKKWLMIGSNVFRAVFILALPLAYLFKDNALLWIYAMTFLVSTATQFFAPAEASMIPIIVEKRNLLTANSLFTTTMLASVVVGFAVGEPILRAVGDHFGHLAIAGMYLGSTLFLFFVRPRFASSEPPKTGASILQEMREGFDFLLKDRRVLIALARIILLFSAFAALTILVIGFVEDVLLLEKRYFGYLLAVAGVGMGIGAGVVGRFGHKVHKDKLIFGGFLCMGSVLIILANVHMISSVLKIASSAGKASALEVGLALGLALLLGMSAASVAVPLQTQLQEEIPEHLRGKVFGVQNMLLNTALTLPMSLAGVMADYLDQRFPNYGVVISMSFVGSTLLIGAFAENALIKSKKYGNKEGDNL